ncbi:homeodomain-like protein [Tanacetum coccineum]
MAEYSQKWHNGTSRGRSTETSDKLAAIQAQLNNLGTEIKKVNEKVYAAQVGCEQCKGPHYTKDCPLKEEGKTLEEAYYTQFGGPFQDMPKDIKVPLILGGPFLSTARAKIDVYKREITLRVGEENIIFKSVKPASSLMKRVYMLSLRERMELDLEARLMGETLLRRNHGDDLMPTIKEGEVIEEFRTRDKDLDTGIDDYPSYCDNDKKIYIDWDNVVRALMNVPIFVGTFSVVTNIAILEDMDAYRDEGKGDVIVGEPFLRKVGIKAR